MRKSLYIAGAAMAANRLGAYWGYHNPRKAYKARKTVRKIAGSRRYKRPVRYGARRQAKKFRKRKATVQTRAMQGMPLQRFVESKQGGIDSGFGQQQLTVLDKGLNNRTVFRLATSSDDVTPVDLDKNEYNMYLGFETRKVTLTNTSNAQAVVYLYVAKAINTDTQNVEETAKIADNIMQGDDTEAQKLNERHLTYAPFTYSKMKRNWKCIKSYRKVMQPGSIEEFDIKIPHNRLFKTTEVTQSDTDQRVFKGVTSQLLLRVHGTPGKIESGPDAGKVTTTNASVDYICHQVVSYKIDTHNVARTHASGKLVTNDTAQPIRFINEETHEIDEGLTF